MGYEIDFLPVEAGERSGDAIAFKIWNERYFWVCVIDGGYTESGDDLVEHVNKYYGTNVVDLAILTHPDDDHASGMLRVIERMDVRRLWMHQPWNHGDLARMFQNDRVTDASVRERLRRDLEAAKAVETATLRRRIPIEEPYANISFDNLFYCIGPTRQFYDAQIANFRCTPAPAVPPPPPLRGLRVAARAARQESWTAETLDGDCETSAENNTSVILAVKFAEDYWGMFTGDAGEPALIGALDWLDYTGFSTTRLNFVQIPHHGSEHNISPAILNRWIGRPQQLDVRSRVGFVSSSAGAPKHPSEKVMNAFRRRGAWPYATEGRTICQSSADAPARPGWVALDPYPFYQGAA